MESEFGSRSSSTTNRLLFKKLEGLEPAGRPAGLIKTLKNTKLTKMQLDFKEI